MAKIRGKLGQFTQVGDSPRSVRSLRLTDTTWETLGQIAESQGETRADLVEEFAATYYTANNNTQPSNTWVKELEELREWKARAESRLRESDGWQEQLAQLQRANLRNSGEAEKAEERALAAEAKVKELEEKLKTVEKERDELDKECSELHSKHGDALNEIEMLKERLATVNPLQSDATVNPLQLPEPAVLLNQLKGKHSKSKASLKDVEEILGLIDG